VKRLEAEGEKMLRVSQAPSWQTNGHAKDVLYEGQYRKAEAKKKQALTERIEKQSRVRILDAISKKLQDIPSRADLEMVCLDYFRRLGHDNHRRLCKVYGWDEKKTKASWGGETVDYEKIVEGAVQAMSTAELHRFLVVCALVSDRYCPGYDPKQPLEKSPNLARTAVRYKIDSAKIATAVRAELSKAKARVKDESQAAKIPTTGISSSKSSK
jgi:hypothetical protein